MCPHLPIVEPGVDELVRQAAFALFDVVDEGAEVSTAPSTGGYGAGSGKEQPLAAVALESDTGRVPFVDLPERNFAGFVVRFDALDDLHHGLIPSCRPAHPVKAYERQRGNDVFDTLVTI